MRTTRCSMDDKQVKFVRSKVSLEERLCQLAEEAAELAQAALKLRRAYGDANPTTLSCADAYMCLREEVADVALCLYVFGIEDIYEASEDQMTNKLNRWCERLKERKNET